MDMDKVKVMKLYKETLCVCFIIIIIIIIILILLFFFNSYTSSPSPVFLFFFSSFYVFSGNTTLFRHHFLRYETVHSHLQMIKPNTRQKY